MSNILAMPSWELESDPEYPHKKPGAGLSFRNPKCEARDRSIQEFTGQPD